MVQENKSPIEALMERLAAAEANAEFSAPAAVVFEEESPEKFEFTFNDTARLFEKSGTSINMKEKWFEVYNKAQASKKDNYVVKRIKAGRFIVLDNSEVVILPNHDVNKSANQLLNERWIL